VPYVVGALVGAAVTWLLQTPRLRSWLWILGRPLIGWTGAKPDKATVAYMLDSGRDVPRDWWPPRLNPANYEQTAWMPDFLIYEAAFLWFGYSPPRMNEHWSLMTDAVSRKKTELHLAVSSGDLAIVQEDIWVVADDIQEEIAASTYPSWLDETRRRIRRRVTPFALAQYCDKKNCAWPDFVRLHPNRSVPDAPPPAGDHPTYE